MSLFRIRRFLSTTLLTMGILPFVGGSLHAQAGTISGRVTDAASGAPIENAEVRATGPQVYTAVTGADGSYRIVNVADGAYTVLVRRIGFEPKTMTGVRSGATLNIAMTARLIELSQTVVTASRSRPEKALDAPASISVISSERIAERPSVTIADHLRSTPGIDVSKGGITQSNIVARGFNNAFSGSMLMLQDYRFAGVPSLRVNVPFLFTGTNEDIDRVEVLLGPASTLYGPNSANGVLHIITKSPFASQGTTVSVDAGERALVRIGARSAFMVNPKLAFKVSGEVMQARDWEYKDLSEPATFPAAAPAGRRGLANQRDFDLEKKSGEVRMDIRPSEGVEAITTFGYTRVGSGMELTGANGTAQIRNWTYANLQQRFRWNRLFLQAFVNSSNAGNKDSTDLTGTYLLQSGQPIVDQSKVYALQAQHGFDLGEKQTFTYGLDYIATNPETKGTINGRNEAVDNMREYGGYLQSSTKLIPKVELLTALRVDGTNVIEGSYLSPRAAVIYKPSENHSIRGTYNRAFSTPANFSFFLDLVRRRAAGTNPYDLYVAGNPPKEGFSFRRDCTAGSYSGVCMRSPFTQNAGFQTASVGAGLPGVWTAIGGAVAPSIQGGLVANLTPALGAATAQAIAAQVTPLMVARIQGRVPTEQELPTGLFVNGILLPDANGLTDITPLKASFNNTYELGYKAQLASGKVQLDISAWGQERGDVGTSAGQATPTVLPRSTQAYTTYLAAQWQPILQGAGIPSATATALANGIAASIAGSAAGQLPIGVVTWDADAIARNRVYATYTSASNKPIWIRGLDVASTLQATPTVAFQTSYSYQDRTIFQEIPGGNGLPLMSNSPSSRGSLAVRYDNAESGWAHEVRARYTEGYEVNSAAYSTGGAYAIGTGNPGATGADPTVVVPSCPNAPAGRFCFENVPEAFIFDVNVSKRFEIGSQKMLFAINAQNLFDNRVRSFPGVPQIGRMLSTRLQYTF